MNDKEDFDEASQIKCPHCDEEQYIELCEGGTGLVTYHGEEPIEWECHECKKDFWIREQVSRYWTTQTES